MKFIDGDFIQRVDVDMDANVNGSNPFENLDISKLSSNEKETLEQMLVKMSDS